MIPEHWLMKKTEAQIKLKWQKGEITDRPVPSQPSPPLHLAIRWQQGNRPFLSLFSLTEFWRLPVAPLTAASAFDNCTVRSPASCSASPVSSTAMTPSVLAVSQLHDQRGVLDHVA
jgi:hypothetical protein